MRTGSKPVCLSATATFRLSPSQFFFPQGLCDIQWLWQCLNSYQPVVVKEHGSQFFLSTFVGRQPDGCAQLSLHDNDATLPDRVHLFSCSPPDAIIKIDYVRMKQQ